MISLSICMIVKNEEEILGRCLDCAKQIADEIIIVDTGSEDKTKEIARNYTNKVYDFKWCFDFSKARNFSFSKATKEYIMWLDADDIILEEDIQKILKLKEKLKSKEYQLVDMILLKYNMMAKTKDDVLLSYYRERIFKRSKNYQWISPIHEVIVPSGNYIFEDIAITHKKNKVGDQNRNLQIFENMIKNGVLLDARQKFYYARELFYHKQYEKSLEVYQDFLQDKEAWKENAISACIDMAKIYQILGNENKRRASLFQSFVYDIPRAEVCCELGQYFLQNNQYQIAIYWYEEALTKKLDYQSGGFYLKDCYHFIPHIQLCVCYDKLKDYKKAMYYNELANQDKPNNEFYKKNKEYFSKILN